MQTSDANGALFLGLLFVMLLATSAIGVTLAATTAYAMVGEISGA